MTRRNKKAGGFVLAKSKPLLKVSTQAFSSSDVPLPPFRLRVDIPEFYCREKKGHPGMLSCSWHDSTLYKKRKKIHNDYPQKKVKGENSLVQEQNSEKYQNKQSRNKNN